MSDTIADRPPDAAAEMLVVACPTDASLNRVPRAKLDRNPKCGRCHNPLFAAKAVELNGANFDSHALIAERYGIRGIPSMVMIRKGQEIARTSGAMPTSAIVNWVEQALQRA